MAKKGTKKRSNNIISIIIVIIAIIIGMGKSNLNDVSVNGTLKAEQNEIIESEITNNLNETTSQSDLIKIHYLDVGQGDSILLESNKQYMLIDAGTNESGSDVVKYLNNLNINKLDYVVGTHPHEDHIGGLDDVINNFEVENVYMPKIQTNTKTFEDVLDAINNKGLKITSPDVGSTFNIGEIECEIMLCGSGSDEEKNNLNLSSIAIRATYGEQSYLFMGDAETENEKSRKWTETNVLKVGHHGSNSSSSASFLKQINPKIAIISCGKDNSYGHPKSEILKRLEKLGTKIYRTDENGTIILTSDGENNYINVENE